MFRRRYGTALSIFCSLGRKFDHRSIVRCCLVAAKQRGRERGVVGTLITRFFRLFLPTFVFCCQFPRSCVCWARRWKRSRRRRRRTKWESGEFVRANSIPRFRDLGVNYATKFFRFSFFRDFEHLTDEFTRATNATWEIISAKFQVWLYHLQIEKLRYFICSLLRDCGRVWKLLKYQSFVRIKFLQQFHFHLRKTISHMWEIIKRKYKRDSSVSVELKRKS